MSLRESLDELTRLTPAERRLLCRRALAVDEADEIAALAHTAAEGFALLDRMEAGDAAPVVKAGVDPFPAPVWRRRTQLPTRATAAAYSG